VSRREQIRLSDEEVAAFLAEQRTVVCATNGPDGWPHLMPLWYIVRGTAEAPGLWAWTYAASQKVRNLRRDPRATLQVEAGEEYQLLRGVMFKTDVTVHSEVEVVRGVGLQIFARYAGSGDVDGLPSEVAEMVDKQAPKRVALQFTERERATWDHRKLGGAY
jgi:Pyridoxamine 5'-phosphate oxidase